MERNHGKKSNIKLIALIAALVIICLGVAGGLFIKSITAAVALEQEIRCGIEEHAHTDSCYEQELLVCKRPTHSHDGNCYIVLLNENDINGILTHLADSKERSLESMISNVMTAALKFNENLNTPETQPPSEPPALSQDTIASLNDTISDLESLPELVLNEKINNPSILKPDTPVREDQEGLENNSIAANPSTFSVNDTPVSSDYNANFYVYLDKKWTCIGTLPFTTTRNGTRYNSTIATEDVLNLVNTSLGTDYDQSDFDVSVASSLNGSYSKTSLSVGSSTTTIGYRQNSNNSKAAKYVRLIPKNATASSTAFAFYTVRFIYPGGTTVTRYARSGADFTLPDGNYEWTTGEETYAAGETITITATTTFTGTLLGPITYINIHYDVDFPIISGVTVSTAPTLAGSSSTTVTDEFTQNSSALIRNVSRQTVEGKVIDNSTNLSRVIQFKGWRVGTTDTIIQPNTTLIWDELLQYATGNNLKLTAVWEYNALQTASFFIRFDSVAVDTEGNVTGQDQNLYTNELFSAYVGGVDTSLGATALNNLYHIVDTTSDNSFGADQEIRALYGEKTDGVWLSAIPNDNYIFENLVDYAETGYLSVDGVTVKAEDLNSKEYAIRWYVFKCQADAWHIDGKLVKKVGLIHVYKTFAGNKELIAEAKTDFYIDATDISAGTNTVLNLNNYTQYNAATDTYMWEITNVDYGEYWEITEHPHLFADPSIAFGVYSEYTVMDAHGDQSTTGSGTSLTVSGMTYALDEGVDEVLRAEFTNIYNKSDSIVIKKQDSLTGVSIGGATFRLLQNGKALKFNYDSETERYQYNPENGTETILSGTANGYFEITIENFSYDLGPITIQEVSPPIGYTPIGEIKIGYLDDQKTIGILSGNSELIKYVNGILIVGNSTDSSSVTAQKNWDCPESEWQDVTIQLLANGKLVTTVIAGVEPQVVLNNENQWEHTWENLPVYVNGEKIQWSIKETMIGSEAAKSDGSFVNWLVSYELPIYSTDDEGNENTLLTVTNTTKRVMLRLTKTDLSKTIQLPDAAFLLEAVDASGNLLPNEISKSATTGAAGTLVFDNLKCNVRYRLTETSPPAGYHHLNEYIYFMINEDGSVTVEDHYFAEAGNTAYNILVRNAEAIPLPESGGAGECMFYALGLLFLIAAAGIYINTLKRGWRN